MARRIILKTFLSPGDICTLTAAVESLHGTYPGQFVTDVRTSCDEVFENNPHITKLADDDPDAEVVEMHYSDLIDCDHLGKRLPGAGGELVLLWELGASDAAGFHAQELCLSRVRRVDAESARQEHRGSDAGQGICERSARGGG
jgi:hypothetical protein